MSAVTGDQIEPSHLPGRSLLSTALNPRTNPDFAKLISFEPRAATYDKDSTIELWRAILAAYFPLSDSYNIYENQSRDEYHRAYTVLTVWKYK